MASLLNYDEVRIGALRWPLLLAARDQRADPDSTGLVETYSREHTVLGDVQPIGGMTFYQAAQVDTPITHRIVIRWRDWIDTNCVIFRITSRYDGSQRKERFRIRRVYEIGGRKRFLRMDCELEGIV